MKDTKDDFTGVITTHVPPMPVTEALRDSATAQEITRVLRWLQRQDYQLRGPLDNMGYRKQLDLASPYDIEEVAAEYAHIDYRQVRKERDAAKKALEAYIEPVKWS